MSKKNKNNRGAGQPNQPAAPTAKPQNPVPAEKPVVSKVVTFNEKFATPPASRQSSPAAKGDAQNLEMPFKALNYKLLMMGIGILILGFVLLGMGNFVDAEVFSVPLYIAPWVIIGGYVWIIFAILAKKKPA